MFSSDSQQNGSGLVQKKKKAALVLLKIDKLGK